MTTLMLKANSQPEHDLHRVEQASEIMAPGYTPKFPGVLYERTSNATVYCPAGTAAWFA